MRATPVVRPGSRSPPPVVREIWPTDGPIDGGTTVWILATRAQPANAQVSFGFRSGRVVLGTEEEPLEVAAASSAFEGGELLSAVSPPQPRGVARSGKARVHVGVLGQRALIDRLDAVRGLNGFSYTSAHAAAADRPRQQTWRHALPAIFDGAAHTPRHGWRAPTDGRVPRAIAPGSRCADWLGVRPFSAAECEAMAAAAVASTSQPRRAAARAALRWRGVAPNAGFAGCLLWGTATTRERAVTFSPAAHMGDGGDGACNSVRAGGWCLCLGPPPPKGARAARDASAAAHDARAARAERGAPLCARQRTWQSARLPLQGWNEFEAPATLLGSDGGGGGRGGGGGGGGGNGGVVAAWSVDVVTAVHSHSPDRMLAALAATIPPTARVSFWWIHKGGAAAVDAAAVASLRATLRRLRPSATPAPAPQPDGGSDGSGAEGEAPLWVMRLKNVGRNDHSFVHFIVARYASLADALLFVKDTTWAHSHLGVPSKLLTFAARLVPPSQPQPTLSTTPLPPPPSPPLHFWCARSLSTTGANFSSDGYVSELCAQKGKRFVAARAVSKRVARCYPNETFVRSAHRPLGRWMDRHGLSRAQWPQQPQPRAPQQRHEGHEERRGPYCAGGVFAASRAAVRSTRLATYERLRAALSVADNLEEGHYTERVWATLLGAAGGAARPQRARLVVYAVHVAREGGGGGGGVSSRQRQGSRQRQAAAATAVAAAPCGASARRRRQHGWAELAPVRGVRSGLRGHQLGCWLFSDDDATLEAAAKQGWQTCRLEGGAAQAAALRRAPHSPAAGAAAAAPLREADYTALVLGVATAATGGGAAAAAEAAPGLSQVTVNVPLLLDRLDELLSRRGASVGLVLRSGRSHRGAARLVIRRATEAAARFGDAWHAHAAAAAGRGDDDDATLRRAAATLPAEAVTTVEAALADKLLLRDRGGTSAPLLQQWWEWWACRRTCCEPSVL